MDTKKPLIPIKSVEERHDYSEPPGQQIQFITNFEDGTSIQQVPTEHYNMMAERGKHEDGSETKKLWKRLRSKEPKQPPRSFHTNLQTNLNIERIKELTGFSLSHAVRMGLGLLLAMLERDQQLYQQRVDTIMQRLGISPEQLNNRIEEGVKYRIEKVEVRLLEEDDDIPEWAKQERAAGRYPKVRGVEEGEEYKGTIDSEEEKPV